MKVSVLMTGKQFNGHTQSKIVDVVLLLFKVDRGNVHFKMLRYFLTKTTGEKLLGGGAFAAYFAGSYWAFLPRAFWIPSTES